MKKELEALLIKQQEEAVFHRTLEDEFNFYRSVRQGDLKVLDGNMDVEPDSGMGTLSDNPLRNMKYHLIILIAMLTRFCIEGGLANETAYTMSDLYIRQIDAAQNKDKLTQIKREAITDFTKTMHALTKPQGFSLPVIRAMDYIQQNLTQPLTNKQISQKLNLHPDYLSRLFKKEMGLTLKDYVMSQKCQTACYMLENSSVSCTDISAFLGFSSCSHFTCCFKKYKGETPESYRRRMVRNVISSF